MPDSGFVYIQVHNGGSFVASFFASGRSDGLPMEVKSGNFKNGDTKTVQLPAQATDISFHVKSERFINDWHTIHSETWPDTSSWPDSPQPTKQFDLSGPVHSEKCKEVQ